MIRIFRTVPMLDFLTMAKTLPDISGRVTALVPKGMTGECLRVLLLS